MYPSFSKLSAGAEAIGGPFDMLDGDALDAILSSDSFDGEATCDAMLGVCSANHPLHKQCTEAFFKAASGRMGFGSPEGGGEGRPPAPSWRDFFAKSCRWLRRARDATDDYAVDFYAQTLGFDPVGKWAILVVLPSLLKYVPIDRADYGELARIAVAKNGWALEYVPTGRPDYGAIARIAVAQEGLSLEHVPKDLPGYGEIARIAVAQEGYALYHVPKDLPGYGEIARIAVVEDGYALEFVPKDHPEYDEIARLAE